MFIEEFDEDEPNRMWPFCELATSLHVGCYPDETRHLQCRDGSSKFCHIPNQKHWKAARGILEYLNSSSSYGVAFQTGSGLGLVVCADGPYALNDAKRESVADGAVM